MESPFERLVLMTPATEMTSGAGMSSDERGKHEPRDRLAGLRRALGADDSLPIEPDFSPDVPGGPSVLHVRSAPSRRFPPGELAAILAGGMLGTLARYGVDRAWRTPHGGIPWATFAINTSGALALGVLLVLILERWPGRRRLRAFTCVGVLGAWTTMSTLATQVVLLVRDGDPSIALVYLACSLSAGLTAVALGIALGRRRTTPV